MSKVAVVLGAGGFIGSHLVKRLKKEGYWVRGVDLKYPEFSPTEADHFMIADLRLLNEVDTVLSHGVEEVYQLAADMGGAGYIFTGENDHKIINNNTLINLYVARRALDIGAKVFFSSSACVYPEYNQKDPDNPNCSEDSVYPANPDSEYGWEKLFSERMYLTYRRFGLNVCIARFHNIYGPEGAWNDGREKAPAALCRKIAQAKNGGEIEVWGDGNQTRSFLYIDECLEGIRRMMLYEQSLPPLNVGSEEMVTINQLAEMIANIAGKNIKIKHIPGPTGVRGRCSDNKLISEFLNWEPEYSLHAGLIETYSWINNKVHE